MAINFTINGNPYSVSISELPVDITLNNFIREHVQLSGTKFMCLEGGCGVCICVIKGRHPVTNEHKIWATNSCLTLLNVCDGWDILTIEGIGNKKDGYHPIQERLAHLNGTQCGYCSPGFVMNMYALLESTNGKISMEDVENSFGGNMCRCTGYRSILDAMKSFSNDFDVNYLNLCSDIEDLSKKKVICPKSGNLCSAADGGMCKSEKLQQVTYKDGSQWYSVKSIKDIFDAFDKIGTNPYYTLVAGNTGHGVYRRSLNIQTFIDVNKVPELRTHNIGDDTLKFGANLSLTETMEIFMKAAEKPGFGYCKVIYDHFDLIANVPVRNMGTLAGNLSLKNQNMEFPSDVFITFEGADAKVVIMDDPTNSRTISLPEYIKMDMNKKIIKSFILNKFSTNEYLYNSYKIMPRAQNAHAYVNAAFLIKLDSDSKVQSARLCFGGINPDFIHATNTEKFLIGKDLFDDKTIQGAMETLYNELKTDWVLPDASPEYRKTLATGLFYKFILKFTPDSKCKQEYKSGGSILKRELSRGKQTFEVHEDKYPLTKPIPKIEALVQCSGEAKYANDIPNLPNQAWAAFVTATEVNAKIVKIDANEALKVPGVIAFFSKDDIPGKNSFISTKLIAFLVDEEIFISDKVKYYKQPLGVIIAESTKVAEFAAQKVKVMYEKSNEPPMPTMKEIFEYKAFHRIHDATQIGGKSGKPCKIFAKDTKKITGNFEIGSQYHYTMEPQTTICVPTEDGMEIHSAAQWMDLTQTVLAEMLNVKKNSLHLQVRRVGGGYGAKISRGVQIACACALACHILNQPIRFVQTIESMMSSLGKRIACRNDYEVEVDKNGKIMKMNNDFYEDAGCSPNESPIQFLSMICFRNCYKVNENWKVSGKDVITDAPSHTACRAPGSVEGIAMIENIMEHIARELDLDPMDVRMNNIPDDNKMKKLLPDYMKKIDYKQRKVEIDKFNKLNRWKKKGIGISIMQYPIEYFGMFPALVSIYHPDGTVSISHGGIEMGQGLNTKVVQVAAHTLGIPMEMIKIEPSNTFTAANSIASGGSVASESVCLAVRKACEDLLSRLKPIKDTMKGAPWADIIVKAFQQNINLIATNSVKIGEIKSYNVWGISCSEIEVDILTGNVNIQRVDILEDTGESLSPLIDIGQIEGSFIMGIGYWLTEQLVYDQRNGELLSTRTWTYKPPGVKDIPIDFRIDLIQKAPNPAGVLRSKTAAEPAICLTISVLFAVRHALNAARNDAGIKDKWYHLGAPTMPEHIVLNSGSNHKMFNLN